VTTRCGRACRITRTRSTCSARPAGRKPPSPRPKNRTSFTPSNAAASVCSARRICGICERGVAGSKPPASPSDRTQYSLGVSLLMPPYVGPLPFIGSASPGALAWLTQEGRSAEAPVLPTCPAVAIDIKAWHGCHLLPGLSRPSSLRYIGRRRPKGPRESLDAVLFSPLLAQRQIQAAFL